MVSSRVATPAVERGDVDAELLAQEVGEGLRDPVGVPSLGEGLHVVAGVGVEHAVEAEVDRAAVVVGGRAQVVPVEDRGLVREDRLLRVGVVDGEPAELVVLAGGPGRRRRDWGWCNTGRRSGSMRTRGRRRCRAARARRCESTFRWRAVQVVPSPRTSLTLPRLLEHEQPAVGGELHRRGAAQPGDDRGLGEPGGQRRRRAPRLQRLESAAGNAPRRRLAARRLVPMTASVLDSRDAEAVEQPCSGLRCART